jgi:hypothetical protein
MLSSEVKSWTVFLRSTSGDSARWKLVVENGFIEKWFLMEYSIPRGGEVIRVYLNHGVLRRKHILLKDAYD